MTGCGDRAKPVPTIDERYKVSVIWKQPAAEGVFFAQDYRILGTAETAWDESRTSSLGGFNAKGDPTRYSFSRVVTGTVGQAGITLSNCAGTLPEGIRFPFEHVLTFYSIPPQPETKFVMVIEREHAQPGGAANRSQPAGSETNRTPPAAGSGG